MFKINAIIFIIMLVLLPYSIGECGVFKICQDGKIVAIKEVEQLCFIDVDKHEDFQDVFIRLELLKEHKNSKYFLSIFPIPFPMERIEFNRPTLIWNIKLIPMTFKKNSNSVINIIDLFKGNFFIQPTEDVLNFPFFKIWSYEAIYNVKKNSFGTVIRDYYRKEYHFSDQHDIIQPASIDELKFYFQSNNEELSAEAYLNFEKYIKSNSFFVSRTARLPVKKNISSTLEGLLELRDTDSVYVKHFDEYELIQQRIKANSSWMDIQLTYPKSPLHCPIPICSSEADNIHALTVIINNFVYLGNSINNYYFDIKQYFFNKSTQIVNVVRTKLPMKQLYYDISNPYPIGYTIISTKKNINNVRVNNLRILLPSEKHNEEILSLAILLILFILLTKLIFNFNLYEISAMSVIFLVVSLFASQVLIISAMVFMCTMYRIRYMCLVIQFQKLDYLFLVIFSVLSFFDVLFEKTLFIHITFLVALLVFGIIYQKELNLKVQHSQENLGITPMK